MSNRFVSGGTISSSNEPSAGDAPQPSEATPSAAKNSAEWEAVQKGLEADRQRREEQRRKAASGEDKSLYDILQENKAAKQAAFEEQTKVRNQFRALDDDEIEFLDEVRDRKKQEEERVRKETEEGLKAFREHRKGEERGDAEEGEVESWGVGRKRKRVKEREIKGVRRRVSEGDASKEGGGGVNEAEDNDGQSETAEPKTVAPEQASAKPDGKKPGLALVDYGSDDSD